MNTAAEIKIAPPSFRRKALPPREFLKECLDYNPETGILKWKERPLEHFTKQRHQRIWNKRYAGTVAGNGQFTRQGRHARMQFDMQYSGRRHLIANHIAIWEMVHGQIPQHLEVDHINGDAWDNRLCNLRLATRQDNCRNRKARDGRKNQLPKGVFTKKGKFYGCIGVSQKTYINSPPFTTPEEARGWYQEMAQKYHGDFFCAR